MMKPRVSCSDRFTSARARFFSCPLSAFAVRHSYFMRRSLQFFSLRLSPRRRRFALGSKIFLLLFLSIWLHAAIFLVLREPSGVTVFAIAAAATAKASEEPFEKDPPLFSSAPLPKPPTLYQEEKPLPFLQEKTLFLIANEPVLESHVASNLLHQLLYTLRIPNDHVWLLDELLLQGPQNAKFATLLPWLVHTYHHLPRGIEYIWIGTSYSRIVGPALEKLLRMLHNAGTNQQQNDDKGDISSQQSSHYDTISPHGLCLGFGLKDASPSIRHHYFSDQDFVYPFLSAGLLLDRRFLHFLTRSVQAASNNAFRKNNQHGQKQAEETRSNRAQKKEIVLPARIEIDALHELFKYIYDQHNIVLTHSDLFCPDNPMPRSLDRTEIPYPAPHRRQRRPAPARTLLHIRGRKRSDNRSHSESHGSAAKEARGNDVVGGTEKENEGVPEGRREAAMTAALRKAENELMSCVSFTVGSRHSPILSHQFFDRLMDYEEDKIERKEKATRKYPLNSLLDPDSTYTAIEDEILNERPPFIVEPEDLLIAIKTHDRNLQSRVPLLKKLWASEEAVTAMAKRRIQQSQPGVRYPFGDTTTAAAAQEELEALEDNMEQLSIVFFADKSIHRKRKGTPGGNRKMKREKEEGQAFVEGKETRGGKDSPLTTNATGKGKPLAQEEAITGKTSVREGNEEEAATGPRQSDERGSEKKRKETDKVKAEAEEEEKGRDQKEEHTSMHNLVRVPVSFPNQKRSLCEKLLGILKYFYTKEKKRRFLLIADDDTLINVRHLLDLISLSLQPPIPARIFFRQALTNENAIRQAHEPYKQLAAAIDTFMLPWRRAYALASVIAPPAATRNGTVADSSIDGGAGSSAAASIVGDGSASPVAETSKDEKRDEITDKKEETQKRNKPATLKNKEGRRSGTSSLTQSYVASAYSQGWRKLPDGAPAASAADTISPLYLGERYSFGHTAALAAPQGHKNNNRTGSSNSDKQKCSKTEEKSTVSDKSNFSSPGAGLEISIGAKRHGAECETDCSATTSCSGNKEETVLSATPSVLSYPFVPSSFSRVNRLFSTRGYDYITGGGGIVLDRAAVHMLLHECPGCVCPADGTADDMLLGLWLQHLLHVPAVHSATFHQERPQEYHAAHLRQMTPLSFHRLDLDNVEASTKEFQKYLDVGEGLNIGKFEDDDFQSLDWVDHDWQQVEDLLWHEADDVSPDFFEQAEEEEEDEEEEEEKQEEDGDSSDRRIAEDAQKEQRTNEGEGGAVREKGEEVGTLPEKDDERRENARPTDTKKRKKKRSRHGDMKKNLDFPFIIQQIFEGAAQEEGRTHLSNEEVEQRLLKKADELDSESETEEGRTVEGLLKKDAQEKVDMKQEEL